MSNIDKTTEQYKVALKYVNIILKNCNKPEITALENFTKIPRKDILKQENIDALNNGLADEIFKYYDKTKLGFYRKYAPTYPICVLKGMIKSLNLKFEQKQRLLPYVIDNKTYLKAGTCYYINL